jgi:hypothetical protein
VLQIGVRVAERQEDLAVVTPRDAIVDTGYNGTLLCPYGLAVAGGVDLSFNAIPTQLQPALGAEQQTGRAQARLGPDL